MPTNSEISEEWNANATARHKQIASGIDISYNRVLMPAIIEQLGSVQGNRGVDVGCGPGVLTRALASKGGRMVGVDLSKRMIEIANSEKGEVNIDYEAG